MSIDFSTLQGLTIPEGVVTQITDESGRVIWAANVAMDEPPAIFEVAKQTTSSYSGETQYTDNEFVLFDIYPKKGGTVNVTYGGLTKTVKDTSGAEEPNAIQVFFGRFNGETDEVATPASGTLTIEGAYRGYGLGSFGGYSGKSSGTYASCVTSVVDFGNPVYIGGYTFRNCANIVPTSLPSGLTEIGGYAFQGCRNLALTSLPSGLTEIGAYAFHTCFKVRITEFPEGLTNIGNSAFEMYTKKSSDIAMYGTRITFPSTIKSIGAKAFIYADYYSVGGEYNYYTYINPVVMLSETPPTLGADAFGVQGYYSDGITSNGKVSIVVPKGCSEAYKSADTWSRYKNCITEAS